MKRFLLAFILLLFLALPVQAAYMYQFDYQFYGLADDGIANDMRVVRSGVWTYFTDNLIGLNSVAGILPSDLASSSSDSKYPFTEIILSVDLGENKSHVRMHFDLSGAPAPPNGGQWWPFVDWFFVGQSFNAPGTYITDWGHGATMAIREIPAGVPEPITVLLLGLGLVGLARIKRKLS